MSNQLHNFTQALALRAWYAPTPESADLLQELDRDLLKWGAHVSDESTSEQVVCVIYAVFDRVRYCFTLRVHAPVEIKAIDTSHLALPYRGILKTHQRSRNILKNFLPVVLDRLCAHRQFELVTMYQSNDALSSHCIWATNVAGLGLSIASTVTPEEPAHIELEPEPLGMSRFLRAPAEQQHMAQA